jgi:hypothetical protein
MANGFLTFTGKFLGRYARLARLNLMVSQLMRREVAIGGLVIILGVSFWNQWQLARQKILGARQEIVAAEIREKIAKLEPVAEKVNARDVWLHLALLNWQIFDEDKAREFWQKAWFIDPNNEQVISVRRLVQP